MDTISSHRYDPVELDRRERHRAIVELLAQASAERDRLADILMAIERSPPPGRVSRRSRNW